MTEKLYYKKWSDRNVESGISKGTNVKTVKSLLGHSTAATTMSINAHEIQSAEAAASAAVAAMLDNELNKRKAE